jgi:hypothetical protein
MIGVVEHYDGRAGMEESLISAIKSSWGENNE